jgi:hypothetical protein
VNARLSSCDMHPALGEQTGSSYRRERGTQSWIWVPFDGAPLASSLVIQLIELNSISDMTTTISLLRTWRGDGLTPPLARPLDWPILIATQIATQCLGTRRDEAARAPVASAIYARKC